MSTVKAYRFQLRCSPCKNGRCVALRAACAACTVMGWSGSASVPSVARSSRATGRCAHGSRLGAARQIPHGWPKARIIRSSRPSSASSKQPAPASPMATAASSRSASRSAARSRACAFSTPSRLRHDLRVVAYRLRNDELAFAGERDDVHALLRASISKAHSKKPACRWQPLAGPRSRSGW